MRICFVGAVESSRFALEALLSSGTPPSLMITLPSAAASRHSDFADLATPARDAGIDVHFTSQINAPETVELLVESAPDLTLVVGWSQICHRAFRAAARIGTLGYHPSPLPDFRGRAVIPWTILTGETTTGSTLFWLDEGMDSGPIVAQRLFAVSPEETARTLYDKHMLALSALTPEAVASIAAGKIAGVPQDHARASYCARRTADDGLIDWRDDRDTICRLVRAAGSPYPGAFTFDGGCKLLVDRARPFTSSNRFIGLPGQVQTHTDEGFTVLCGNGALIEVLAWRSDTGTRPKVHARLRPH